MLSLSFLQKFQYSTILPYLTLLKIFIPLGIKFHNFSKLCRGSLQIVYPPRLPESKVCSRSILQCLGSRLYVTRVKHRSPVKEAILTLLNSESGGFTFCKRLWPAAYRYHQCFIRGFSQHLPIQPLHDQKILSFGRDIKENLHLYLIRKCLVKYLQWHL